MGMNCVSPCYGLKEGIPVLRLFSHVMDAFGNIRQRTVDIDADEFFSHK
jgi:hypothetical protein